MNYKPLHSSRPSRSWFWASVCLLLLLVSGGPNVYSLTPPPMRWQSYSRRLLSDPNLLMFYSFGAMYQYPNVELTNLAIGDNPDFFLYRFDPQWPGNIVQRPIWANSRWGGNWSEEPFFDGKTGSQGDFLVIPDAVNMNLTDDSFSVVVIVQRSSPHDGCIVGKAASAASGFELGLQQDTAYLRIGDQLIQSSAIKDIARWHLIAAVFTKDSAHWQCDLVIDGKVEASMPLDKFDWDEATPFYLGQTGYGKKFFHGMIGEVMVFNRDLSINQLAEIHKIGVPKLRHHGLLDSPFVLAMTVLVLISIVSGVRTWPFGRKSD